MSQIIRKGPLPPEDAAANYASDLYARLRCEYGWRADAFSLLRQEYAAFARAAIAGDFGVLSMWEYMQLVEATSRYLHSKGSRNFSAWFYMQASANLRDIYMLVEEVLFDEREEESMHQAFRRIVPAIRSWRVLQEARE
jgi:hypothetical protein